MDGKEARKIINSYQETEIHSPDDDFMFVEACQYIINEEHDTEMMLWLGGWYYERKRFDLALKYYELAASFGNESADECLGYIWYYGRTGQCDYEKAFKHFSAAAERGNVTAKYKIADMYKNGYYVDKDYDKYVSIIEELYPIACDFDYYYQPLPDIFTRLAKIRVKQDEIGEAINLYLRAKDFLAERLTFNSFFGDLNIMKWLIGDLYQLVDFGTFGVDFYDLYYLLTKEVSLEVIIGESTIKIYTEMTDGECNVNFNGKWFRNVDDFFGNASINGLLLTEIYSEIDVIWEEE